MIQYLVIGRSVTSMVVANNLRTLNPQSVKTLRHPLIWFFNQSACIFISGTDFIMYGVLRLIPMIIKEMMPLYNSPFVAAPISWPPLYPSQFCKYISLNMRHTSLDIFSSSFNNFADFAASISPLTIFRNDKEGNRNWSKSNLYDCMTYIEALMQILLCQMHKPDSF